MKRTVLVADRLMPKDLFKYCLIILVILTIAQTPVSQGVSFFSLLHDDINDTFMDFFNSIFDAITKNPYEERGIIYPPLTQLYYRLCALFLPDDYAAREWRSSQPGLVLIVAVTVLTFWFLSKCFLPTGKEEDRSTILLILFGTVPFWFAIERANIIILTLAFLSFFVQNYRSESALKRELALLSLAVAVAFKIYPVCFGILLLLDKQYKAAIRCVIYGIVLFFLPFYVFGGIPSIKLMIANIAKTSTIMNNLGYGYKLNLDNTLGFLSEALHVPLIGASAIKLAFLLMIAVILFMSHKEWQKIMALSAIMIVFPGFSYTYTMVFAALPLILFLRSDNKPTTRNYLFSILFVCMFAPFPLEGYALFDAAPAQKYALNLTTAISSLALLAMIALICWDTIFCHFKKNTSDYNQTCDIHGLKAHVSIVRFAIIMVVIIALFYAAYLYCDYLYHIR